MVPTLSTGLLEPSQPSGYSDSFAGHSHKQDQISVGSKNEDENWASTFL